MIEAYEETRDGINAYKALAEKHEMVGPVKRASLQRQLNDDRLGDGEDPDAFCGRLESYRRQLGYLGKEFDHEFLLLLLVLICLSLIVSLQPCLIPRRT